MLLWEVVSPSNILFTRGTLSIGPVYRFLEVPGQKDTFNGDFDLKFAYGLTSDRQVLRDWAALRTMAHTTSDGVKARCWSWTRWCPFDSSSEALFQPLFDQGRLLHMSEFLREATREFELIAPLIADGLVLDGAEDQPRIEMGLNCRIGRFSRLSVDVKVWGESSGDPAWLWRSEAVEPPDRGEWAAFARFNAVEHPVVSWPAAPTAQLIEEHRPAIESLQSQVRSLFGEV